MIVSMLGGKCWISKLAGLYKRDHRRHVRLPADFAASIAGTFGAIGVTCVNAHRGGAGIQSPEPLPLGTLVFLRMTSLGLAGFAHVRHCSQRGDRYLLGLKFRNGLSRERNESDIWDFQRIAQTGRLAWDQAEA